MLELAQAVAPYQPLFMAAYWGTGTIFLAHGIYTMRKFNLWISKDLK